MSIDKNLELVQESGCTSGTTYTIHPTTAPPRVNEYFGECEAYMFLKTDAGGCYVSMSCEHLEAMLKDVLTTMIGWAMDSDSLDRWHNALDDIIDEIVQRNRAWQTMTERAIAEDGV